MEKDELLENEEKIKVREEESGPEQAPVEEPEEPEAPVEEPVEAETGTAESDEVEEAVTEDEPLEENTVPEEKMLTQSQVNELVGKARAEGRNAALKELYGRYGVNDDNEMNDVFGKGQGYDLLNEEYETLNGNFKSLSAENALLKSGIVANRWEDVKAILGNKGLDVTTENIESEIATHPEWREVAPEVAEDKTITPELAEKFAEGNKPKKIEAAQPSTIKKLGSNVPDGKTNVEESDMMRLFGLK